MLQLHNSETRLITPHIHPHPYSFPTPMIVFDLRRKRPERLTTSSLVHTNARSFEQKLETELNRRWSVAKCTIPVTWLSKSKSKKSTRTGIFILAKKLYWQLDAELMQNCSLVLMWADLLDLFSKCQVCDVGDSKPFEIMIILDQC